MKGIGGIGNGVRRIAAIALVCLIATAAQARLTDPDLDAALVVDAKSGQVLYARNETATRHPASLTKMMTLYLLFEHLRHRDLALTSTFVASANAARQPRSRLRLREGDAISADMAIKAIVVCSANDAAVTVAEGLGGSEARFAQMMNAKAQALGMTHTVFHNATGLPDELQRTTAADLALLARHLIYDFPEYYGYFGTKAVAWRGEEFTTHNGLIGSYAGADGIKTGYIDASGYNLVGTAERKGRRIIAVVMGGLSPEKRDTATVNLLDAAFETPWIEPPPAPVAVVVPHLPAQHIVPKRPKTEIDFANALSLAVAAFAIAPGSPLGWLLAGAAVIATSAEQHLNPA